MNKILEIGCYEGKSTAWFLSNMLSDTGQIYCNDNWLGGEEHKNKCKQEFSTGNVYSRYRSNTRLAQKPNQRIIEYASDSHRALSHLSALDIHSGTFDFIFVYGSHKSENVIIDASLSFCLLRSKGIMLYDDYLWTGNKETTSTPKKAIDAFLQIYGSKLNLIYQGYQVLIQKQ